MSGFPLSIRLIFIKSSWLYIIEVTACDLQFAANEVLTLHVDHIQALSVEDGEMVAFRGSI